ncbi:uncharacterized protein LOC100209664 isoform X1 [Hydra vulgaris]|uniref:uncharacterized protein LOC100209664 isoform X1 n=1 Tax=Hydra vulgaris TaxID=6087 RepID=UPI00019255C1|nr:uncharacterized protein LOC100209664 [Hydra vulgaris]
MGKVVFSVTLFCILSLYNVFGYREMTKRFFCKPGECGPGQCCKKYFLPPASVCMSYIPEGERCMFGDAVNLGCGCAPGLECMFKKFFWYCVKPNNEPEPDEEEKEINQLGNEQINEDDLNDERKYFKQDK